MKHIRFCLECRQRYAKPTTKPFLKPFQWSYEPDVTDAHSFASACYLHPVSDGWRPSEVAEPTLFDELAS